MKVGFFSLLTILFIALKLAGYIGWSWVWVLSPLWISLLALFIMAFGVAIVQTIEERRYVKNRTRR